MDLNHQHSVRPMLDFLKELNQTKFIFKDIGTEDELKHYLKQWTLAKNSKFNVGYFSFHGEPGALCFPDGRKSPITLEEVGEWLQGRCQGRIIHFCACSVMQLDGQRLQDFQRRTKAYAVMGYGKYVDWAESVAFDLLLFHALNWYQKLHYADKYIDRVAGQLREHLGFRIIR